MMADDTWPGGALPVRVGVENGVVGIKTSQRVPDSDFAERACRAINSFDTLVEALEILLANPKTGRDRAHAALAAARKPEV